MKRALLHVDLGVLESLIGMPKGIRISRCVELAGLSREVLLVLEGEGLPEEYRCLKYHPSRTLSPSVVQLKSKEGARNPTVTWDFSRDEGIALHNKGNQS